MLYPLSYERKKMTPKVNSDTAMKRLVAALGPIKYAAFSRGCQSRSVHASLPG